MNDYSAVLDRAISTLPALVRQVALERRTSAVLLERLDRLTPAQRELALRNRRAVGRSVVEGLLARAREAVRDDPHAAAELARLAAMALARATDLPDGSRTSLTLACALEAANALRAAGDLRGASAVWCRIDVLGLIPLEPLEMARFLSLRASYEDWVRHPRRAIDLLCRAVELYREHDDREQLCRTLTQLSVSYLHAGDAERSMRRAVDAVSLLTARDDTALRLVAVHNLAAAAAVMEDAELLASTLRTARRLYEEAGSEMWRLRRDWLLARLNILRRELPLAEGRLERLASSFRRRSMPYEVALVGLDQMQVDALRGRWPRVSERAELLAHSFSALGVEREALISLLALRRARGAEALQLLASCVHSLRGAARRPGGNRVG